MDKAKKMRINEDSLIIQPDQTTYYNEKLYTGVAYELHSNGNIKSEVEYLNGIEHGFSKKWNADGVLIYHGRLFKGVPHGKVTEKYDDGKIKSSASYEYGIELNYKLWSKDGLLEDERCIQPDSIHDRLLKDLRSEYSSES